MSNRDTFGPFSGPTVVGPMIAQDPPTLPLEPNKNYNESNLETMARMPDGFIDLTVTSPPYDNLRAYTGYHFDFECIAKELYRVTKEGGVVVWVVGDATVKGSETGASFRQALYFMECGFNLHDTMIYRKTGGGARGSNLCYWQNFEYMFVFSKGRPKSVNLIHDKINVTGGNRNSGVNGRGKDGGQRFKKITTTAKVGRRENVWTIPAGNNTADDKTDHPAVFPESLAGDHIITWSAPGDLVYDPFMGSGTTAKMSMVNDRRWIGSEISFAYCEITEARVKKAAPMPDLITLDMLIEDAEVESESNSRMRKPRGVVVEEWFIDPVSPEGGVKETPSPSKEGVSLTPGVEP